MSHPESTFRDRLRAARPDIAERERRNEVKRKLAMALRTLRKRRGITQVELESRSGLAQSAISRLEAPTGALPQWDTVLRYVEACDGHMLLGFSLGEIDETAFRGEEPDRKGSESEKGLVSSLAV